MDLAPGDGSVLPRTLLSPNGSTFSRKPREQTLSDCNHRGARIGGCNVLLAGLRHTIEEINEPGLQRVLGTYDEKSISLDQFFEDLRSVSQMVCGDADVGANGLPHQSIRVVPEFCRQQRFHGWPNTINDRMQIPRLVSRRLLKFFQRGENSPAL